MGQCFSPQENKKEANTNSSKVVKTKEEKNTEKVVSFDFSISNLLVRKAAGSTRVKRLGKRQSTIKRRSAIFTSKASYLAQVSSSNGRRFWRSERMHAQQNE